MIMSYVVKDTIQGKNISLVYGAPQISLAASATRAKRSKVVRDFLSENSAGYTLVIRSHEVETWFAASSPGVSLAAAIEAWHETREDNGLNSANPPLPANYIVVIPTDTRVYLAEITGGQVNEDYAATPDVIDAALKEYIAKEMAIYGFSGGACTDWLTQYIMLEELPFDWTEYAFKRVWSVFLRTGLFHPVYFFAGAFAVVGAVIPLLIGQFSVLQDFLNPKQLIVKPPQQIVTPKVRYSAGDDIRGLVSAIYQADALFGDGLTTMQYGPAGVLYSGDTVHPGYPDTAAAVAVNLGAVWNITAAGWTLQTSGRESAHVRKDPAHSEAVIKAMLDHPLGFELSTSVQQAQASSNDNSNIVMRPLRVMVWAASVERITAYDLLMYTEQLDQIPGSVTQAQCSFRPFYLDSCTIEMETRTL